MPQKNKEDYNEYQRAYQLARYHKRRAEAIKQLGGKCSLCDKTNDLEFDHIDPTLKSFGIGCLWSCSEEKFQAELSKCQLLCHEHHSLKSIYDAGKLPAKNTNRHGHPSMCRYCDCDLCHETNNRLSRESKRRRRQRLKKEKP